jgi:diacylglycerol O-acyltransferase
MKKLSLIDWSFLQAETPQKQAHVAGLWIFQLPKGYRGNFFRDLIKGLADGRSVTPPFNLKLKMPLPKLDLPSWVEDEQVDLDYHVRYETLPKPGTLTQLMERVEDIHGHLLDRSRPLWELYFFKGLQGRRIAIYFKMHHALVDGIAGLELMVSTFSPSPEARATRALWQPPFKTFPEDHPSSLLAKAGKIYTDVLSQIRALPELSATLAKTGLQALHLQKSQVPLPFTAPKTLLNRPVSAQRSFAVHSLSLSAVKTLSEAADATVNDVILAVCAGALRRYLSAQQALPEHPLVAWMPVSVRSVKNNQNGNQVTVILCSLATELADPKQRFRAIKTSADAAKAQFSEHSVEVTSQYTLLLGGLLMLTQQFGLTKPIAPPANVVISNLPGPRQALYLNGAKLMAQYPLSMLIDGLALNITITSHGDCLDFGLLACREALPNVRVLADYLGDAFAELQVELTKPLEITETHLASPEKLAVKPPIKIGWSTTRMDRLVKSLDAIPMATLTAAVEGQPVESAAAAELWESLEKLDKTIGTLRTGAVAHPEPAEVNNPDMRLMKAQSSLWNLLIKYYFRLEIGGWERLPERPALLVGIHSGGALTMDAWTLIYAWWQHFQERRILHGTAHDALMNLPGLGFYFRHNGVISPTRENIAAAFAAGHDVILWPGGEVDSFRAWAKRDRVVLGGRKGFIRLAIRLGVPIVPVATIGGHDTFFVLSEGRGIAKLLGLKKHFRTELAPITLSMPFGITLEPLPTHIPLPAKIRTEFLEPVELDNDLERADDKDYVDKMYHDIEQRLQVGVDRLAQRRRFRVFG